MNVSPIYRCAPNAAADCLCHGEILSDVIQFRLHLETIESEAPAIIQITYGYAVVLSQACDLVQDHKYRQEGKSQLPGILLCQVPTAEDLKATPGIASDIWKRIRQNKDERYHFLEKVPPELDALGQGLPELGIDFKRYFTLPTDEVYRRFEIGPTQRRSVLSTPYLEHLCNRFSYFLSRVALPRDHVSE